MKVIKKEAAMAPYARKEDYEYEGKKYQADIQNDDRVTIKTEGQMVTGQYGDQYEFLITTRNGDRLANFNQKSINLLVDALGDETSSWIGKEVTVLTKRDVIANKRVIIAYFAPAGFMIDEWGEVVKDEPDVPRDAILSPKTDAQKQVDAMRNEEVPESPF